MIVLDILTSTPRIIQGFPSSATHLTTPLKSQGQPASEGVLTELAHHSDVVLTMLPDDTTVQEVLIGKVVFSAQSALVGRSSISAASTHPPRGTSLPRPYAPGGLRRSQSRILNVLRSDRARTA